MKRIVFMILGALLLACCATLSPEQKAAQEAERAKSVRTSLANQQYRIKVTCLLVHQHAGRRLPESDGQGRKH